MIRGSILKQILARPECLQADPMHAYRLVLMAGRFSIPIEGLPVNSLPSGYFRKLDRKQVLYQLSRYLLKAPEPSRGILCLQETGILQEVHPLLHALLGCEQEKSHHPEGDVFQHTLLVVDQCRQRVHLSQNPQALMLAALLHDIGKPATTGFHKGKVTSYGHDVTGSKLAAGFLRELHAPQKLINKVQQLVREHMQPVLLFKQRDKVSDKAIRRLLGRVDSSELLLLSEADYLGRGIQRDYQPIKLWLQQRIERLKLRA